MAIYLGSNAVKVSTANTVCNLVIPSSEPFVNGVMLLSFDNYILKDENGLYLTTKESE